MEKHRERDKNNQRAGGGWTRESGKSETIVARVCSRRELVRAQFARQENACFDGSSCGTLLILHFSRFDELPYWTNGPNTKASGRSNRLLTRGFLAKLLTLDVKL